MRSANQIHSVIIHFPTQLALSMPDFGPHTAFLASNFSSSGTPTAAAHPDSPDSHRTRRSRPTGIISSQDWLARQTRKEVTDQAFSGELGGIKFFRDAPRTKPTMQPINAPIKIASFVSPGGRPP
jgi:hypothetical protein